MSFTWKRHITCWIHTANSAPIEIACKMGLQKAHFPAYKLTGWFSIAIFWICLIILLEHIMWSLWKFWENGRWSWTINVMPIHVRRHDTVKCSQKMYFHMKRTSPKMLTILTITCHFWVLHIDFSTKHRCFLPNCLQCFGGAVSVVCRLR